MDPLVCLVPRPLAFAFRHRSRSFANGTVSASSRSSSSASGATVAAARVSLRPGRGRNSPLRIFCAAVFGSFLTRLEVSSDFFAAVIVVPDCLAMCSSGERQPHLSRHRPASSTRRASSVFADRGQTFHAVERVPTARALRAQLIVVRIKIRNERSKSVFDCAHVRRERRGVSVRAAWAPLVRRPARSSSGVRRRRAPHGVGAPEPGCACNVRAFGRTARCTPCRTSPGSCCDVLRCGVSELNTTMLPAHGHVRRARPVAPALFADGQVEWCEVACPTGARPASPTRNRCRESRR